MTQPATVPATTKFLTLVAEHFAVLENFHPGYPESISLVDPETRSGITVVIVESAERN